MADLLGHNQRVMPCQNSFYEELKNISSHYNSVQNFYKEPPHDQVILTSKQFPKTQCYGSGADGGLLNFLDSRNGELKSNTNQLNTMKSSPGYYGKWLDKENIIRRAELEACRKIQEIEDSVRAKLRQRRTGIY